jgi:hypothetical protein
VLGAILMMLPLLWPRGADGHGTAQVLIYLFTVWTLLIAAAFVLTRRLRLDDAEAGAGSEPEGP